MGAEAEDKLYEEIADMAKLKHVLGDVSCFKSCVAHIKHPLLELKTNLFAWDLQCSFIGWPKIFRINEAITKPVCVKNL